MHIYWSPAIGQLAGVRVRKMYEDFCPRWVDFFFFWTHSWLAMPSGKYIYLNMITSVLLFVIVYAQGQSRQLYAQPLLGKLTPPTIFPEQKVSFLCITLAWYKKKQLLISGRWWHQPFLSFPNWSPHIKILFFRVTDLTENLMKAMGPFPRKK